MSEIEDRRQRAREAAYDAFDGAAHKLDARARVPSDALAEMIARALEAGIETAMRVQVTDEVTRAAQGLTILPAPCDDDCQYEPYPCAVMAHAVAGAALRAAGFEVEE